MRALARSATLLALLFLAGASAATGQEKASKAPNFRATDMNGKRVSLEELLGEGPILVNFWATWCKPCIQEMPYVQRLHDEYGEKGLTVLATTIDSPRSQSRVRPFIQGRQFTFRVLMDAEQDVFRKLQGKGTIPYSVILDAEGHFRYRHTGYRPGDEKELEKIVLELFDEAAPAKESSGEVEEATEPPGEPSG
jgi:peroxiredoxin